MEKQTFEIPQGCSKVTVEQIGNQIVTTFEPEKYIPKVGDCVKLVSKYKVHFFEVTHESDTYVNSKISICNGSINVDSDFSGNDGGWFKNHYEYTYTKITNEEYQAEHNKLGYEYDFEKHEAKKLKWKPEEGEKYYCVDMFNEIDFYYNENSQVDKQLIKIGNCYRTHDEAIPRQQHYLSFKD